MFRNFFIGEGLLDRVQGNRVIRLEEYLEDDTCVVRAELPGIDPDKDVEISVETAAAPKETKIPITRG